MKWEKRHDESCCTRAGDCQEKLFPRGSFGLFADPRHISALCGIGRIGAGE
jgi:hypothetical protein